MPQKNKKKVKILNGNNKSKNGNSPSSTIVNSQSLVRSKDQVLRQQENLPSETLKYAKGLLNPFSEHACGARVPDQFYAPTTTVAYRDFASIANNIAGQADLVIIPSIMNPCFSTRGSLTNGAALVTKGNISITNGAIRNTPIDIYNKITSHRIVNWGIRIRNTSAVTNASGIITIALFNIPDNSIVPHGFTVGGQSGSNINSTGAVMSGYLNSLGLPKDGGSAELLDIASLVDFPCHMRVSSTQLCENTYQVVPKLISPRALEFRASNDNQYGTEITTQASLSFVQPGNASYIKCDGWTGIAIGYTGGSATAGNNTFDIEIVYNVEGAPNVSLGTTLVGSSAKVVCDPVGMMKAQSVLDMASAFAEVGVGALTAYRQFAGRM